MIKAIIFDFDGVLVESVDIKTNAFAKLFEFAGKESVRKVVDYHLKNAGVSRFEKIKYIYKNILNEELSEETFGSLCQRFSHFVVDEVVNAPYVKGAQEFLDGYAAQTMCFVASATPQGEIEEIIAKRQMSRYFKEIHGAPQEKTDVVKHIVVSHGITPGEIVYIGDALSDYHAAKDNSIKFIARMNNNQSLFADVDCLKIPDLTHLDSILVQFGFKS